MTAQEVFSIWAPPNSPWSAWVAPVLFAQTDWEGRIRPEPPKPQGPSWLRGYETGAAVVVDLPGADSVEFGIALAQLGFRPVPLYNASPAPDLLIRPGDASSSAAIDMGPILDAIGRATTSLQRMQFAPVAPPVFLLDAQRLSGTTAPEIFDNRWIVFPQDFPSAGFLAAHGIQRVLLVQNDRLEPADDLSHVLLRWQEAGIVVLSKKLNDEGLPSAISVKRPSRYKSVWYRLLAILSLRRNSAGGFGSYVPEITGAG